MTSPMVTVLTAVHNGASHIDATIESIRQQTYEDWELLIVDDASTDATVEIVERWSRIDPRILLIRREISGGPYAAANIGIGEARGRYIARIDADDIAPPTRLIEQLSFLDSNASLTACSGYWQTISDRGDVASEVKTIPTSPEVIPWHLCVLGGFVHSSAFVSADAFRSLGGYRDRPVSQDYRMWCTFARKRQLGVVPTVVVMWRMHTSSISANRSADQAREHIEILMEHLSDLTGERWDFDAADALWRVGRTFPIGMREGLDALDRWESGWRSDALLSPADRKELTALATRLRLKHLKWNGRREVSSVVPSFIRIVSRTVGGHVRR